MDAWCAHWLGSWSSVFINSLMYLYSLYLGVFILRVEYAKQRLKYGILFIFSPVYEYSNLEYGHVPV